MNVSIMLAVSFIMLSFSFGILFVYTLVNIIGSKRSKKDYDKTIQLLTEANEHRSNIEEVLGQFYVLINNYIKDEKAKHPPIDVMK